MKKIAIIGSASFIAGYVIEELHKQGHYTIGVQRHESIFFENPTIDLYDQVNTDEIYFGDITNSEIVSRVVSISDGVINLAGRLGTSEEVSNPFPAVEVNIKGTLNVLEACKIWKKPFVQIAVGNHWMDNTYSITRTTAERFTRMYANEFGVEANVVRALNAYGPRQSYFSYKKMMPAFVLSAIQNKPLKVNGDGKQVMDFIHVRDLAEFLVMVLLDPEKAHALSVLQCHKAGAIAVVPNDIYTFEKYGNTYQCGEGDGIAVEDIAKLVIELTGSKSEIEYVPMRAGEPMGARIVADYQSPTYKTTLREGLPEVIEYYRKNIDRYSL